MSIALPPISGGSIQPEYVATNLTVNLMDGMTANINYQLMRYVLDANGQKVGLMQPGNSMMVPPPEAFGGIMLTADEFAALVASGNLQEAVDALVKSDLVKRGVIQADAPKPAPAQ